MAEEKILIVEDEEDIRDLIAYALEREGYKNVYGLGCGEDALKKVDAYAPDLILLDLMLPGMDGMSVCRKLKQNENTAAIPVIMLTAKSEETDIVLGLEMGADDYITKPFSNKVLLARVRSVLRRSKNGNAGAGDGILRRGDIVINPGKREVQCRGESIVLTFSEFEILYMMAKRPGWVYTRNQIVNQVKGSDYPVTERAVDVQIVSLRKKLGEFGKLIETIRGVGYRFAGDRG